jgi:hypothetical protein
MLLTSHKIHFLKVYGSVVLVYSELCNQHYYLTHHPKNKPQAQQQSLPSPLCHWFFFFFLQCWDLNSGPTPWATPPALFFVMGFFQNKVSQTICLGWLQILILLISSSWVAGITGVSTSAWLSLMFVSAVPLIGFQQAVTHVHSCKSSQT